MIEKKYIISLFGEPVIFDRQIMHIDLRIVAKSAGFVKIWIDDKSKRIRVHCYGESMSLGLYADPSADNKIIEDFLNNE
jgi:hypothetical protein